VTQENFRPVPLPFLVLFALTLLHLLLFPLQFGDRPLVAGVVKVRVPRCPTRAAVCAETAVPAADADVAGCQSHRWCF